MKKHLLLTAFLLAAYLLPCLLLAQPARRTRLIAVGHYTSTSG